MAEIEVIRAGEEHALLLCGLFYGLHQTHTALRPDFFAPITDTSALAAQTAELIRTKQRIFLLALLDGRVCGYLEGRLAVVDPAEMLYTHRRFAKVENLYTVPEYRRRGVASKLMDSFVHYAAERGFASVELQVLGANAEAIAFYQSMGFGVQQMTLEKTDLG